MAKQTLTFSAIIVGLLFLLSASPAHGDSEAGFVAHEQGDYATALREFRRLAGQGNPVAQYNLGVMYA
ncbi:MAG: hypothetical protein V3U08_01910, partial [Nitrospirales bacterium]